MTWRLFIVLTAIIGTVLCYLLIHAAQQAEKVGDHLQETSGGYQAMNDGRGYRL
jgi:hypothetical protein